MKSYSEHYSAKHEIDNNTDEEIDITKLHLKLPELDNLELSITQTEAEIIINKTKICYGVLLVICIGISWSASTQFAQHVQTNTAVTIPPFALMWFATTFKIFCFIPIMIVYCQRCDKKKASYVDLKTPQSVTYNNKTTHWKTVSELFNAEQHEDDSHFDTKFSTLSVSPISKRKTFEPKHVSDITDMTNVMKDVTPNNCKMCMLYLLFYFLWTGANYCYFRALDSNSATIVTALFSSNNMFIYVLSIFVLHEIFSWFRMFAVVTAVLGIVFIAMNNKNSQIVFFGSVLAIFSSIFAAVYKVYFKKIFGNMHVLNVCKFLGFIGLFNALFMWIVMLILHVFYLERLPFDKGINEWPWSFLIASAVCGLIFDFLINFGIAFTYPLFIALGVIIGIPVNLVADIVFHNLMIDALEMIGVLCICAGFLVIVVTDLHGKGNNVSFRK